MLFCGIRAFANGIGRKKDFPRHAEIFCTA
jgi:hypothetical protein